MLKLSAAKLPVKERACESAVMPRADFVTRYARFDRVFRRLSVIAFVPFFLYLPWVLFFAGIFDGFLLRIEWRSLWISLSLLAILFAGAYAVDLAIPIALKATGLMCPSCRSIPRWFVTRGHVALRTRCLRCGAQIFEEQSETSNADSLKDSLAT